MTTAIIGTGGIGSAIARQLAAGGETVQLSSADKESARKLAAVVGGAAVVALDNRSALQGADAIVLALRFSVLKDVIGEIADLLGDTFLVVPSNPVGLDAQGKIVRLLPEGRRSGQVVAGWLPIGTRFAIAFGSMSADLLESSSHRSPEPTVLFYVSEDEHGSDEVEHLIRATGFEPMSIGGVEQRADSRWAAIFMILWSAPQRRGPSSLGRDCIVTPAELRLGSGHRPEVAHNANRAVSAAPTRESLLEFRSD
jgi:8-hydroxy-5-deazaflavin:NADPH oxidoreductase